MLLRRLAAIGSALVVATATLSVGSASAHVQDEPVGEQTAGIKQFHRNVHVKKRNPDQAVIKVRYKCEGTGTHLWASVKQGRAVNQFQPTEERPSPPADIARAWYETPEGPTPTCDGKARTLRYTISRVTEGTETHPEAWERLKDGRAWAQFVIFYAPPGANPADPATWQRDAFAGWVQVKAPNRRGHGHHH
jgi:hypothetical protein